MSEPAPAEANDPEQAEAPLPIGRRDLIATALLFVVFTAQIALAIAFARPFASAGLQAFEDPEAVSNSVLYFGFLLAFTVFILWLAKKGYKKVLQWIVLTAIAATVAYVLPPLLLEQGVRGNIAWGSGIALGVISALALWKHPEWYVIDAVGFLVAAAAAAIFGISLGVVPVIVLLVVLAIYDAIAVYRTKHMLSLADAVMDLRLPVLFVMPKTWKYRFLDEVAQFRKRGGVDVSDDAEDPPSQENAGHDDPRPEEPDTRDALFIGLGDFVIPTILIVSAIMFAEPGWGATPAAGAAAGMMVGFTVLMAFVLRGKPQAGLPLLNGGAIAGFLAGLYAATGSIVFW